jgi:exodeoxyribonuclease VII small subunit
VAQHKQGDMQAGKPADRQPELTYEQARDELAEVVRRLEAGGLTLEDSLRLWERGERLAGVCEEWLEGARARLSAALSATPGAADRPAAQPARPPGRPAADQAETPF